MNNNNGVKGKFKGQGDDWQKKMKEKDESALSSSLFAERWSNAIYGYKIKLSALLDLPPAPLTREESGA